MDNLLHVLHKWNSIMQVNLYTVDEYTMCTIHPLSNINVLFMLTRLISKSLRYLNQVKKARPF
jgi:hypothetical protein